MKPTHEQIKAACKAVVLGTDVDGNDVHLSEAEAEAALTAALSATPAGVVKLKPLEWRDEGTGVFRRVRATTSIGTYSTWRLDGSLDYSLYYNEELIKTCSDLEAAKSAAFADYSARIMSAIEQDSVVVETEDVARRIYEDACVVCGEHLEDGDEVYWSANDDGHMHAECATSYVDDDGNETDHPPTPIVFQPSSTNRAEGQDNG